MSFVTYLATKASLRAVSPEIPDRKRFESLNERFSKEEIAYYCFIQVCWQWNNIHEKPDFKEYIKVFLKNNEDKSGWHDVDFTYEGMMRIHKNMFGVDFDPQDKDFLGSILDPRKNLTKI